MHNLIDINHKKHIAAKFNAAAKNYHQYANFQKIAGVNLINLMRQSLNQPSTILDLGCGTGYFANNLSHYFPQAAVFAVDFAANMLHLAYDFSKNLENQRYIQADFDHLPLNNEMTDSIYSNMAIQWSLCLANTLTEWRRVLKPNGLVFFSTLGKHTFYELQIASKNLNHKINYNTFLSIDEIKIIIAQAGFQEISIHSEIISLSYADIYSFLHEIKKTGANYVINKTSKHFITRQDLKQLEKNYEKFRNAEGKIIASYELIYGVVKKHA